MEFAGRIVIEPAPAWFDLVAKLGAAVKQIGVLQPVALPQDPRTAAAFLRTSPVAELRAKIDALVEGALNASPPPAPRDADLNTIAQLQAIVSRHEPGWTVAGDVPGLCRQIDNLLHRQPAPEPLNAGPPPAAEPSIEEPPGPVDAAAPGPFAHVPGGHPLPVVTQAEPPAPRVRVWSIQRDNVVRRRYPAGDPVDAIRDEVNGLPGPTVTSATVRQHAAAKQTNGGLGLRRPAFRMELPASTAPVATSLSSLSASMTVERAQPQDGSIGSDRSATEEARPRLFQRTASIPSREDGATAATAANDRTAAPSPPAPAPAPAAAMPPPPVPHVAVPRRVDVLVPTGVETTNRETIRQWAGPRGLVFHVDSDLDAVNARRRRLGMRPFEIEDPRGRRGGA